MNSFARIPQGSVRESKSYRRLADRHELHAADDGAQGQFQFLHGEPHADAVARTQSERDVRVRVQVVLVLHGPAVGSQHPRVRLG